MLRVAAVMIARNEEKIIARALESVRPYVDRMIVLDAGSTDNTVACARNCGAEVFHFQWCDDFAKARNAALEHSQADWNLVLDADEYLVEGAEQLKAMAATPPDFIGTVAIDSSYGANGEQQVRNWLARLLPREIRFIGRIHEQPAHSLPLRPVSIRFNHDGYQTTQRDMKKGRNESLLRLELAHHPDDAYLHYQLGKEKEVDDAFAAAVASYQTALTLLGTSFEDWHRDLVVRCLFCMKKIQAFDEALDLAAQWENHLNALPDYHFVMGDLYLDMALALPSHADTVLPLIEAHWLRCLEIGEKPEIDGCVTGRGSTLAAHNLHAFYHSLGLDDKAALYKQHS